MIKSIFVGQSLLDESINELGLVSANHLILVSKALNKGRLVFSLGSGYRLLGKIVDMDTTVLYQGWLD